LVFSLADAVAAEVKLVQKGQLATTTPGATRYISSPCTRLIFLSFLTLRFTDYNLLNFSMVRSSALIAAAATLLANVDAAGLYGKNSAVLQVTGVDYDRLIAKSNYTSVSK
jgi:hypothetical protein